MKEFISFEEARAIVLDHFAQTPEELVSLEVALGRTLARDIASDVDTPPFDTTAMDGYAVRLGDTSALPANLRVKGEIAAGGVPGKLAIEPGTCIRVMTGAPLPEGADAVAPVEWTTAHGGAVEISSAPTMGQHIRRRGEDVRRGDVVVEEGEVITPPKAGMLASAGCHLVPVRVEPRVAIVATGDELVEPSEMPGPGQIRNSNGPALAAQAVAAGAAVLGQWTARDDKAALRQVIAEVAEADVIVFSGGVSVGEHDFVRQVLDEMGATWLFWKVRQRPGKPLAFGLLGHIPVIGLPGNPVSSTVCFEQYARPAIARMLGRRHVMPRLLPAVLEEPLRKVKGLYYFARGSASTDNYGRIHVRSAGGQGSNIYSTVARANVFIHLPEELENPESGTDVRIQRFAW